MNALQPKTVFQSLTLRSLAAIAIAAVANRFSINLPDGAAQDLAQAAIDLATTLGLLGAVIGRARANGPIG